MEFPTTEVRLFGFTDDFAGHDHTIRAMLFGEMVKRATPVVEHYQSDLYRDVEWLMKEVNGPITFEWVVREWGTNISDSARIQVQIGAGSKAVFYQIALTVRRGVWFATFTTIPLDQVATLPPLNTAETS